MPQLFAAQSPETVLLCETLRTAADRGERQGFEPAVARRLSATLLAMRADCCCSGGEAATLPPTCAAAIAKIRTAIGGTLLALEDADEAVGRARDHFGVIANPPLGSPLTPAR